MVFFWQNKLFCSKLDLYLANLAPARLFKKAATFFKKTSATRVAFVSGGVEGGVDFGCGCVARGGGGPLSKNTCRIALRHTRPGVFFQSEATHLFFSGKHKEVVETTVRTRGEEATTPDAFIASLDAAKKAWASKPTPLPLLAFGEGGGCFVQNAWAPTPPNQPSRTEKDLQSRVESCLVVVSTWPGTPGRKFEAQTSPDAKWEKKSL